MLKKHRQPFYIWSFFKYIYIYNSVTISSSRCMIQTKSSCWRLSATLFSISFTFSFHAQLVYHFPWPARPPHQPFPAHRATSRVILRNPIRNQQPAVSRTLKPNYPLVTFRGIKSSTETLQHIRISNQDDNVPQPAKFVSLRIPLKRTMETGTMLSASDPSTSTTHAYPSHKSVLRRAWVTEFAEPSANGEGTGYIIWDVIIRPSHRRLREARWSCCEIKSNLICEHRMRATLQYDALFNRTSAPMLWGVHRNYESML